MKKQLLLLFFFSSFIAQAQIDIEKLRIKVDSVCPDRCKAQVDTTYLDELFSLASQEPSLQAKILNLKADVLRQQNDLKRAQVFAFKAIEIAREELHYLELAHAYLILGDVHFLLGEMPEIEESYEMASQHLMQWGGYQNENLYWRLQDRLCIVDFIMGRIEEQQLRFDKILEHYVAVNDSVLYMNTLMNGLPMLIENYGLDSSLNAMMRVRDYFRSKNSILDISFAYGAIAKVYLFRDQQDSSIANYNRAAEYALLDRNGRRYLEVLDLIVEVYDVNEDWPNAFQSLSRYQVVSDSVLSHEKKVEISAVRTRLDSELKEVLLEESLEKNRNQSKINRLLLLLLLVFLSLSFVIYRTLKQKTEISKKAAEIIQERLSSVLKAKEADSLEALIKGQQVERKRVGKDLHDRVGSMLATLRLHIDIAFGKEERSEEEIRENQRRSLELLDESAAEVRRISHGLADALPNNFGLISALEEIKRAIESTGAYQFHLISFGLDNRLPIDLEVEIYRIVQEMLSNTLKHAKADTIELNLTRTDSTFNLTFEDNGMGFKVDPLNTAGIGMKNIQERLATFGGELHIDSRPGRGSVFIVDLAL
jgi:signal transduction histidine kinase